MTDSNIIWHPSPNHGDRRDGLTPELVVLHYTAMQSAEAALERLCSPEHEVSSHYLIARDGSVFQLVDEGQRAWHAGAGVWAGRGDVNSRSVGIELDNTGETPFSAPLMSALTRLLSGIRGRWDIPVHGVIGHSDFAPERKFDPGRRFDWRALSLAGEAVWSDARADDTEADEKAFIRNAAAFGYPVEIGFEPILDAFRQRFRPWAQGPLDATDVARITDLSTRFAVDRDRASA